ncbi:class I SAM-dependent methyltransferase [Methylotuvimicrobium buryatense]|uniref:Class I SAM-dependent methyltransferase n=1 Tax=Methylotuvimicrobium buryatense TaxID=95641 RepID=A0A4V1IK70_METBY|nr:class I SAM-dependent methyltransferase [Methylotuvimicrobium buryatense]QCW83875.1 class I SAM-dependent methyltransferase [Methylotuvimicrobium buryatense]
MAVIKRCPACEGRLKERGYCQYGDFDGGLFSYKADLLECVRCGFVRLQGEFDDQAIENYYSNDCMYASAGGIGVGGRSQEDQIRYRHYLNLLQTIAPGGGRLLDVGCSRGGFIRYVDERAPGLFLLSGVDIDSTSVNDFGSRDLPIKQGSVFALPYEDSSQDIICYFHVFEHILNVELVMEEAARVLESTGRLMVEVPDAALYSLARVGTNFWPGMKEHVNHFTLKALSMLGERKGLHVTAVERVLLPMKGSIKDYPSLMVLFSKEANDFERVKADQTLTKNIVSFFEDERRQQEILLTNLHHCFGFYDKVTLWGAGLELLDLSAQGLLEINKVIHIIDSNLIKQKKRLTGIRIEAPEYVDPTGLLVITSYLSVDDIRAAAIGLGWTEKQIFYIF